MVEKMLELYNKQLISENRKPIQPYLHETIQELIIVPSSPSVCPAIHELKKLPLVYY